MFSTFYLIVHDFFLIYNKIPKILKNLCVVNFESEENVPFLFESLTFFRVVYRGT